MRYRGIVFDFNGVLLWDADLQVKSWQALARELRGYEMTEEELATHMHGRPNADVLRYLAARNLAGQELLDLIQRVGQCSAHDCHVVRNYKSQFLHSTSALGPMV